MRYLVTILLIAIAGITFGQEADTWDKWSWLTGEWQGEGSGIPGEGNGVFSFSFDLEKKILVRRSHSEFPGENIKTRTIHDDLLIIYTDTEANPCKAIYFDNEGHTINYNINYPDSSIVLTSEMNTQMPVFRLIYTKLNNEAVYTKFQMSRDGVSFMTYVEGTSKKLTKTDNHP